MSQHSPAAVSQTISQSVVGEAEAARILGLSGRSLQRLRVAGDGPVYVQLTERRIGYALSDLAQWVDARRRASTSAVASA